MIDSETFRDAMRSWVTGVSIISVQTPTARHGMTVNSFTSVSLDPPLILVCIQNNLRILGLIKEAQAFAISVLRADQAELSNRFAGRSTENVDRFEGVPTHTVITGAPILDEALAYFDCALEVEHPASTHTIFVARVLAAKRADGQPLLYWNRGYRKLES
ncbi:MAG: flavin reductase family protein [Chloroflexi bacterium]|nr:flavin reductase family protein [Chloroflexota bacterium]